MGTIMRLILGVVNLLLFLRPCVSTQHCLARIIPPELDSPVSIQEPAFDTGFMSSIVHSFLGSVQPNSFPKDIFIKFLNSGDITDEGTINEVLRYETGFLVCVAIGILYIVLMPLIGLCFACCRCCGNCGGHMYQKQTNSINCRRQSFYWTTFLITFLILAGNICMFLSNTYTHESVNSAPGEFNNTVKNLQSYITTIPKQIDQVVNESVEVVDNVTYNIKEIGPLLGIQIKRELKGSINPALDAAAVMAQVVQNTSLLLYTLNATQKELDLLQSNLTGVKTRINNTLNNIPNCMQCVSLQAGLDKLPLGTSINLSSLSKLQSAVDQAEKTDLILQIQKGKDFFEGIPERVTNATRDSVQKVEQHLQTIKSQFSQVTRDIPLDQLTKFSNMLNTIQEDAQNFIPRIDMVENLRTSREMVSSKMAMSTGHEESLNGLHTIHPKDIPSVGVAMIVLFNTIIITPVEGISFGSMVFIPPGQFQECVKSVTRWIIAVILCCLILLVVVCNLLGLVLGLAGLAPKVNPTERSSTANCGGLFLMAGVGFSFLFSWIFMIVVLILFLIGGNTYTLICVPWKTQQLYQIIDTPGVIPGFQLSQSLGLKTNLTITDVYNDCQMNTSLWNTLHLEDIINLNDYLNVSKYTGQVQEELESTNITLPSIVLLNTEMKQQLSSFSATASSVNTSSIMQKVNTQSVALLNYTADKLDTLANNQTNAIVKAELQSEANDLRFIQTQFNSIITPQLMEIDSEIERFSDIMSKINGTVEKVLEQVNSAQDVLNNNTTLTVKSKLTEFVDCQIGIFTALAEWANQTITEQVGRCGPVAVTVNTVENLFCSQLVDSLNAFWFSLGWCMVFLIPSIIFSVKLAKFYRRMKYKDAFLENMMMNPIPRVNLKS